MAPPTRVVRAISFSVERAPAPPRRLRTVKRLDEALGRLFDALKSLRMLEDTIALNPVPPASGRPTIEYS
jgi:hypothetical protein